MEIKIIIKNTINVGTVHLERDIVSKYNFYIIVQQPPWMPTANICSHCK